MSFIEEKTIYLISIDFSAKLMGEQTGKALLHVQLRDDPKVGSAFVYIGSRELLKMLKVIRRPDLEEFIGTNKEYDCNWEKAINLGKGLFVGEWKDVGSFTEPFFVSGINRDVYSD